MTAQVLMLNTTQKRMEQDLFWYPRKNCQGQAGRHLLRLIRVHAITARAEVTGIGDVSVGFRPRQREGELGSLRGEI
jgi:hypothetical protein